MEYVAKTVNVVPGPTNTPFWLSITPPLDRTDINHGVRLGKGFQVQ